jgi:S-adenosylmethionine-dependent methyltransferase
MLRSGSDGGVDVNTNTWTDTPENLAVSYARHNQTLRGALRHALVARALITHLPRSPQRILDVGGGAGHQAIGLARAGHQVTILDPDEAMLDTARTRLAREPDDLQTRVCLVEGAGEEAVEITGGGFDAVCCHGVLMYLDNPDPLLRALVASVRPGALISILAKNAAALAMRPGIEGRWAEALDVLDATVETGGLGVATRADSVATITSALAGEGASTLAWYGVRVFTDHLRDAPVGPDFDHICDLEWAAGARDPYRQVGRLFHLIAQRDHV